MNRSQAWLAEFVLLAAIWGSSFLFTRLASVEFGAIATAGVRVAIAALALLPVLLWHGLGRQLVQHWKKTFLVGLLNSAIPFACYAFALLTISTGLSSMLNATVPLFGALVAWVWLKDRPQGVRIAGLLLGFVGVALLAWDKASFKAGAGGSASAWAVLACLVACLCYGISASYTKRHLGGVPALVTATGSQLGATLGLALPAWWLWPQRMPSSGAWLALLAVGVLCTAVAFILFFRILEHMGPAGSLTVTFVIPVFALLYGVIFLNESVTWSMALCGALIVCGTALSAGLFITPRAASLGGKH